MTQFYFIQLEESCLSFILISCLFHYLYIAEFILLFGRMLSLLCCFVCLLPSFLPLFLQRKQILGIHSYSHRSSLPVLQTSNFKHGSSLPVLKSRDTNSPLFFFLSYMYVYSIHQEANSRDLLFHPQKFTNRLTITGGDFLF